MASAARASRKTFESVKGSKMIGISIMLFYPVSVLGSCYWSLHGSGDKHSNKKFTFHAPSSHKKIDSNALPEPMQQQRDKIVKETLNIYKCNPSYECERIIALDATFEDPCMFCDNNATIACLIWGLPKICNNADVKY